MVNTSRGASPSAPTNYGDCSSVSRVEDCDSFGQGFESHHSPVKIKYAVVAQLVEQGPEEPRVGCSIHSHRTKLVRWRSWNNALARKTNIRRFEPDSGLKFMPLWGNWLDPADLGSAVEIRMKVRILPGAHIQGCISSL